MAKPRDVVVRFLADTKAFLRGADSIDRAYDEMAASADEVTREGEQSARRLAAAYSRAGDKIERDTKTTHKVTREQWAETGAEAGAEFSQNLGEAISSGDTGGLVSGTLGGLAASFGATGPIGLAIAGLGAVATTVFASMAANAAKAAAAANQAFTDLMENTSRQAQLHTILEDQFGGVVEGLEAVQRMSDASGVSVEAISDALVTGGPAARTLAKHFLEIQRAQYETTGELDRQAGYLAEGEGLLNDRATAMERAANAAVVERKALATSEGILRRSASYYASRGSAYAPGGSVYSQQVPRYAGGQRTG